MNLTFAVNTVSNFCKRQDELQATQQAKIVQKLAIDDDDDDDDRGIKIEKDANQLGTLKRPGNIC